MPRTARPPHRGGRPLSRPRWSLASLGTPWLLGLREACAPAPHPPGPATPVPRPEVGEWEEDRERCAGEALPEAGMARTLGSPARGWAG